jgi:hypothetical protein
MSTTTIRPTQFIVGCYEHLNASFPEAEFVFAELDSIMIGLYNSIRWSIVRRADSEPGRPVLDLPTTDCFASPWMSRDEIVQRISDTSGLEDEMADIALRSIESAVRLSLSENDALAIPPLGVITKGRHGFVIELSDNFQLKPVAAAVAAASAAAY